MSDELDLEIGVLSSEEMLKLAVEQGRRFFSRRESAAILGITPGQAGDLMKLCRLDAFWIGGEYRVHWTSLASFLEEFGWIRQQYLNYLSFTQPREVKHFWKTRKIMHNGGSIENVRALLERQLVKDWLIYRIADRKLPETDQPIEEQTFRDWYDIPGMDLPSTASCLQWARLIGTRPSVIGVSPYTTITYPEMFDWLVEREVVNLPVFRQENIEEKEPENFDPQLALF
ncbi:hypothetical protein [uncultured Sphaerochaeta sp.]|uniref:hypothetical protein n=1 Tax=uncultured Sphaerochaeta sp. TaxID=886478 RepID=UPI0029C9C246|nr:hypothetical protein [uncultured Sphaerochaeta sp.]